MIIKAPTHIVVPHPEAYLVGGSVRDLIRGRSPLDYDIVVGQDPEIYAAKLAKQLKARVISLGKEPFTVYRVVAGNTSVDVAAMHAPGIEADLEARDFTINALACHLDSGRILDPTGGLHDLRHRVVRMVSSRAFAADPLRLLRAFRMAVTLDYDIEPGTLEVIAQRSAEIRKSAGERVLAELHKILASADSHRWLVQMASAGLLTAIFPELKPLQTCRQHNQHAEDLFSHTLQAFHQMECLLSRPEEVTAKETTRFISALKQHQRVLLKLAILLHDIGKPQSRTIDATGKTHFCGHAKKSAALLPAICRRLRMSNHDRDWLTFIIGQHQRPLDLILSADKSTGQISSRALGRFFRQCGSHAPALLLHAMADNLGKQRAQSLNQGAMGPSITALMETYFTRIQTRIAQPLINGNDLIRHFGLVPSPRFGSILEQIQEACLAGSIQNRDQALKRVADIINTQGP